MTQESTQNSQITVAIEPVKIQDGLRLDLKMTNVPQDFFGLAFHLKISGGDWELQKYQLGDVFEDMLNPFVLVNSKSDYSKNSEISEAESQLNSTDSGEIIFGLSLQRGQNLNLSSGKLISFYLKTSDSDLKFSFSDQMLSVLHENRQDLDQVVWKASSLKEMQVLDPQISQYAQASVFGQKAGRTQINGDQLIQVYSFLAVAFFVLLLTLAGFYFYKRNK